MPAGPRPRRDPTDDWDQLRFLVASPEQDTYELLRPIVLFGQPPARARETGVPERTLRRKAARFDTHGMRSLFELDPPPVGDKRRLPPEERRAILELKAAYPAFGLREIARICRERFDHPVGYHAVGRVLEPESHPHRPADHLRCRSGRHVRIDASTVRRMHTSRGDAPGGGYGWSIGESSHNHTGSAGTFFAVLLVRLRHDRLYAVATNAAGTQPQEPSEDDSALLNGVLSALIQRFEA